jgi:hypothetical protein
VSAQATLESGPPAACRHAGPEEYDAFVRRASAARIGRTALQSARAFIRAYPVSGRRSQMRGQAARS